VVIDAKTKEIISLYIEKRNCDDFNLYKKTKLHIPSNIKQKVDNAYQGAQKMHANTDFPKKKSKNNPLYKEDKQSNRKLAQERVYVEHTKLSM
jgi:hypothetical protein